MMDRLFRRSTDPPHRLTAATLAALLAAACVVSAGCVTGPDGRLLHARPIGAVVDGLDGHPRCGCRQHAADGSCRSCGVEAWQDDGGLESIDDWYLSEDDGSFAPLPLDDYDGTCGSTCDDRSWRGSRRRWYEPEAGIFNFCVPPATIGAPAPPPPGRFHPVPTRPVFAPQPSLALAAPQSD